MQWGSDEVNHSSQTTSSLCGTFFEIGSESVSELLDKLVFPFYTKSPTRTWWITEYKLYARIGRKVPVKTFTYSNPL